MINRAKFDVATPSSFEGVKAYLRRDRIALYTLDQGWPAVAHCMIRSAVL